MKDDLSKDEMKNLSHSPHFTLPTNINQSMYVYVVKTAATETVNRIIRQDQGPSRRFVSVYTSDDGTKFIDQWNLP